MKVLSLIGLAMVAFIVVIFEPIERYQLLVTLKKLNKPNSQSVKKVFFPYTASVESNLLEIYEREMAQIKKQWKKHSSNLKFDSKKEHRNVRNLFFHRQVKEKNQQFLERIQWAVRGNASRPARYGQLAWEVLLEASQNPVAQLEALASYPDSDQVGYCFARAMLVHYLLLERGVKQQDLLKVFSVGELMVNKHFWHFHVAVWIRDEEKGYRVIDPLHEGVLSYPQWLAHNEAYGVKSPFSRVRFFATDPRKFLPSYGWYDKEHLWDPYLKKFMNDLIRSLG